MTALKNKIDFALVFTARNANPNGDPLDGNRPRTTYAGLGEVSDVCLKRKIRNRWIDEGCSVFVQSDDRRAPGDPYRSLSDRADGCEQLKECLRKMQNGKKSKAKPASAAEEPVPTKEDYARIACEQWIDVRSFGQVFAFKASKKDEDAAEGDGVSIGIRGPVSIQSAFTLEPVNVVSTQITKSVNLETQSDPDKKGKDTMGQKHRVDFGVYVTYGAINVQCAQKTGFSEEDANRLQEALRTLFRNDATAARPDGSMEVVKVVWWTHNCPNGQYSAAKVQRSLKVTCTDGEVEVQVNDESIPGLSYEVIDGE